MTRFCPAHDADQRVIQSREEARMEEAPVLIERREGYRVLTLNFPRHLNAFTETMHQHLKRALAEAEEDGDCRALLLTGAGRAFCAGQDLHERVDKDGKAIVLGSALGELRSGVRKNRAHSRLRRHVAAAAAYWSRPRARPRAHGRAASRRQG